MAKHRRTTPRRFRFAAVLVGGTAAIATMLSIAGAGTAAAKPHNNNIVSEIGKAGTHALHQVGTAGTNAISQTGTAVGNGQSQTGTALGNGQSQTGTALGNGQVQLGNAGNGLLAGLGGLLGGR